MNDNRAPVRPHSGLFDDRSKLMFVVVGFPAATAVVSKAVTDVTLVLIHIMDVTPQVFLGDIRLLPLQSNSIGIGVVVAVDTTGHGS